MVNNRILLVLGILSLLLVAMVISLPFPNRAASAERGRAADATRWTAIGEYYGELEESQFRRSRAADTARWTAMAERYQSVEAAQNLQRGRSADAARWMAIAAHYRQVFGK